MHFKNQWCTNWQCRRSRCCNANVEFGWIQQKATEKQQAVCGIITETNQVILFLLILSLLNTRQVVQEIFV